MFMRYCLFLVIKNLKFILVQSLVFGFYECFIVDICWFLLIFGLILISYYCEVYKVS